MIYTNTIHALVSPDASLHVATAIFRQFGEIASLELLPGDALIASVVFFDVRAAQAALEVLGNYVAWPAPQTGCRTVRVPGDVHLNVAGVSNVFQDADSKDGSYEVEFFDIRDAQRVQDWLDSGESTTSEFDELELADHYRLKDEEEPVPVKVVPACLPRPPGLERPSDFPEPQQPAVPQTVVIRGLPKQLLLRDLMEVTFQQAGLQDALLGFEILPGDPCGEVFVTLSNMDAAVHCVAHFSGCHWTTSGTQVTAELLHDWFTPEDGMGHETPGSPSSWAVAAY